MCARRLSMRGRTGQRFLQSGLQKRDAGRNRLYVRTRRLPRRSLRKILEVIFMPQVREKFDPDFVKTNEPTDYRTDLNCYELPCGVCGRMLYVDETTRRDFERALEHDLDNQFVCAECERDYEDLAYE
jgi:hypothetical protein